MESSNYFNYAPDFLPFKKASNQLLENIPTPSNDFSDVVLALSAIYLFQARDAAKGVNSPTEYINQELLKVSEFLQVTKIFTFEKPKTSNPDSIEEITTHLYSELFSRFDKEHYVDEPLHLLRQRLERNNFPIDNFSNWSALDSGCGNGRYSVALKNLGMRRVIGLDLSPDNINDALTRNSLSDINLDFRVGDVQNLPFENESFDFVFSNGVVHHTKNPSKATKELVRVLKKGGVGFFKVMPNSGGIHWHIIEVLRVLTANLELSTFVKVAEMLGIPPNLRYFMIDHIKVPINIRYTKTQAEMLLKDAGAKNIRFCERGADIDRSELVYQHQPHAEILYGIGENRFYFEK